MNLDYGVIEISEPLRRRPFVGAAQGAGMGVMLGLISLASTSSIPRLDRFAGWAVGGTAAGMLIGSFLPMLRKRWTAGLVMWIAMSIGLSISGAFWHTWIVQFPMSAFDGFCIALIFASLMWRYAG